MTGQVRLPVCVRSAGKPVTTHHDVPHLGLKHTARVSSRGGFHSPGDLVIPGGTTRPVHGVDAPDSEHNHRMSVGFAGDPSRLQSGSTSARGSFPSRPEWTSSLPGWAPVDPRPSRTQVPPSPRSGHRWGMCLGRSNPAGPQDRAQDAARLAGSIRASEPSMEKTGPSATSAG